MISREAAMRIIAQRTGVCFEALTHYSHAIGPMSDRGRSGARSGGQDGCVTARWLTFVLLAIAIGDAEHAIHALASMENTFLDKVVTQRETYASQYRKDGRVLVRMQALSEYLPEPVTWDLKGESFLEALVGLVEQLALAPDGSHHKFLGESYIIDLTWHDGAPYISIEAELKGPDNELFQRSFEYEPEAAPRVFTSGNSVNPRRKLPIGRTSTLMSSHLKMIAGILAITRDDQFVGTVH